MFCCLVVDAPGARVPGVLEAVARACSPRVEPYGDDAVVFDARGLQRALGAPPVIALEVSRLAADRGVIVRIALTGTMTAAWLLAHAHRGTTIAPPGKEAAALSGLPLETLLTLPESGVRRSALGTSRSRRSTPRLKPGAQGLVPDLLAILARWGLHTLGDLARLPRADIRARLGDLGGQLHQAACGEDVATLVPVDEPRRYAERLELEWPVEGLEPLSFVLSRLCEALSASLERADRGAVTLTTRLRLVTRKSHERVLNLPAPMRDARVLRTLILLDLESHPPDAAIDIVEVELGVTPGRIVQGSLLAQALPSPEDLTTLVARLHALMGESRIGAPRLIDSHDERSVGMKPFVVPALPFALCPWPSALCPWPSALCPLPSALRRFRLPIAARVRVERGTPEHVAPAVRGLAGGRVLESAGPCRTSGRWWALDRTAWDRDEWDVELADGGMYRIARDRKTGHWEIEGVID
jgi:protein ImuB